MNGDRGHGSYPLVMVIGAVSIDGDSRARIAAPARITDRLAAGFAPAAGHGRMLITVTTSQFAMSSRSCILPASFAAYCAAPCAVGAAALRGSGGVCWSARLLLSGCTVGFWSYQQITAPKRKYIQVNCDGRDGPPKLAYYPFHGVFIGVATGPWTCGCALHAAYMPTWTGIRSSSVATPTRAI